MHVHVSKLYVPSQMYYGTLKNPMGFCKVATHAALACTCVHGCPSHPKCTTSQQCLIYNIQELCLLLILYAAWGYLIINMLFSNTKGRGFLAIVAVFLLNASCANTFLKLITEEGKNDGETHVASLSGLPSCIMP